MFRFFFVINLQLLLVYYVLVFNLDRYCSTPDAFYLLWRWKEFKMRM